MKTVFYFTADWCNPCKKMKPIAEEIDRDFIDIAFTFIDADSERELVTKFGIKSVPTLILIEDEKEVNRLTGAKTKEELLAFING